MHYVKEPPVITMPEWIAPLQNQVKGSVITPSSEDYNEARQAWNLTVDQYPAVIVLAESAEDVAQAVRFAKEASLGIAVQSTGHGNVRPADNCLLINTSRMRQVRIDTNTQTAWIEAGVKWGEVLEHAHQLGLAPLLGSSPDVGAIGYTLGGGMGWLARKYGLSTDSVRYFEVVTADGEIRRASQHENSDLFWGMRGGGGSLAVATAMEVQLVPLTVVYAGNLYYPPAMAKEVFARYRQWIAGAPDELTSSIVFMNFPPVPNLPEFLRGQSFVMIRGCYCGPEDEGAELLRYWREWQEPIIDDFKTIPFSQAATISNDPVEPLPGLISGAWMSDLSDEAMDIVIVYALGKGISSPITMTEIRHAGGAISRVEPHFSAYSNRAPEFQLVLIGMAPTPEIHVQINQYMTQFKTELASHLTGRVYMNFLADMESRERIQDGFSPEAYSRLREVKSKYDPNNIFAYSFNIQPL